MKDKISSKNLCIDQRYIQLIINKDIKKRKNEKNYKEDLRKKTKFEISRD